MPCVVGSRFNPKGGLPKRKACERRHRPAVAEKRLKGETKMKIRTIKRSIAKARLSCMGMGNVNKKLSMIGKDGRKVWVAALTGATGRDSRLYQLNAGRRKIEKEKRDKQLARRVIRKVNGA